MLRGAAVLCIPVPFIEQRTWHSSLRLELFLLGGLLLVVWVWHELRYGRTREPLVSLDLFRIRSCRLGAPVGLIFIAGFIALFGGEIAVAYCDVPATSRTIVNAAAREREGNRRQAVSTAVR